MQQELVTASPLQLVKCKEQGKMKVCGAAFQINARSSGCYCATITMEIRWATRKYYPKQPSSKLKPKVPVFLSTDPSHVNPQDLSRLYTLCNHSCYRFPKVDHKGRVAEPVDVKKLGIALSHSSVLVSVFCDSKDVDFDGGFREENVVEEAEAKPTKGLGDLFQKVAPPWSLTSLSPENGRLVGFGRALSDLGLTATIYDVMVIPSLWGMGIGTMIVKRIIRMLSSKDIYDISALCSAKERLFFKACGFRDDDLVGSTTMMYTRTVPTGEDGDEMAISAGRKLLLVPQLKKAL